MNIYEGPKAYIPEVYAVEKEAMKNVFNQMITTVRFN